MVYVQADAGGVNNVYANRFNAGAWQTTGSLIEANGNTVPGTTTPRVAIDAQGNIDAIWLQKNGAQTTDSVYVNRYNNDPTPYYTIPAGADWNSVATAVYGSSAPASQLQSALGNPPLTANNRLTGFPATITVVTTTTVAPYYTVLASDTWSSIAQVVYGDSAAAGPLQAALGNPTLAVGVRLTVPSSLSFTPVTAPSNGAVLSTTDTQTTNYSLNSAALTNPGGGAWVGVSSLESSTAYASSPRIKFDQNGNGIAVWVQGSHVNASRYDKASNTWGTSVVLDNGTFPVPDEASVSLSVDPSGNAIVAWVQFQTATGPSTDLYARRYSAATNAWLGSAELLETASATATSPSVAINASGQAIVSWVQSDGTSDSIWANRYTGSAWTGAGAVESNSSAASSPSVSLDAAGNAGVLWTQSGASPGIYANRFSSASGSWSGAALSGSNGPAAAAALSFDANGNGFTWVIDGNNNVVVYRLDKATGVWKSVVLGSVANPAFPGAPALYVDASGNAIAAMVSTGSQISTIRYDAASGAWVDMGVAGGAVAPIELAVAINASGQAIVVDDEFDGEFYNLIAYRYTGGAWTDATLIGRVRSGLADETTMSMDAAGNATIVWQDFLGAYNIITNRFNNSPASYTVQATDTWASIAQALYGSSAAASALQQALGNPALTAGAQLTGFPPTLSVTTTVTVPAYYTVQQGNTWATITQNVYGTSDANAQLALRDAVGNPALAVGAHITMPSSIRYAGASGTTTATANSAVLSTTITTTVPPYYTVTGTDTWTSITQNVYGTSNANAVAALQAALSNPTLSSGLKLNVPASISYNVATTSSANSAALSYTQTTTVPPYYTVTGTDNWTSITQNVYGTSNANAVAVALQAL